MRLPSAPVEQYTGDPADADWSPHPENAAAVTALTRHESRVYACSVGFSDEAGGYLWSVDAPEDQRERGGESLPDRPTAIGANLRQGRADTEEAARTAAWRAVPGAAVVLAHNISAVRYS